MVDLYAALASVGPVAPVVMSVVVDLFSRILLLSCIFLVLPGCFLYGILGYSPNTEVGHHPTFRPE
jgi:hypothetical protein